jgi:hypothetical protein
MRSIGSKNPMDEGFRRMYYVRYADDFVIGIQGHLSDAKEIITALNTWLQENLKLMLHPDKTNIKHFASESTTFLGIQIGPLCTSENPVKLYSTGKKRRITPRLPITVDTKRILKRLKSRGLVKFDGNKYKGIAYSRMQNLDIPDIIKYFNSVFRG